MPECQDCGNREAFIHGIEGEQRRCYDPETGDLDHVTTIHEATLWMECAACGGGWIEYPEDEPEGGDGG